MDEAWKVFRETHVEVSSLGHVRRNKGKVENGSNRKGYRICSIRTIDGDKNYSIHRMVAECFLPKIKGKEQVNHINGIRHDNRVENLEWCTPKENADHSNKELGNLKIHSSNFNKFEIETKLTALTFLLMKDKPRKFYTDNFKMSKSLISKIVDGYTWKEFLNQMNMDKGELGFFNIKNRDFCKLGHALELIGRHKACRICSKKSKSDWVKRNRNPARETVKKREIEV